MDKVTLAPDENGYTFKDGAEVLRTQLASGSGRFTRGVLNAAIPLSVQWTCDEGEYDYLMEVHRQHVAEGYAPFQIDLIIDSDEMTEHWVRMMPGSFGLASHRGRSYVMQATLEVLPTSKTLFTGTIPKLTLPPDKDGYTFVMEAAGEHQPLDGGLGRVYRDQIGNTTKINVKWTTNAAGFLYLREFYRQWVTKPDQFPMDLFLHTHAVEEYNVWIVPGSMGLDSISGHRFVLSAQIEVDTEESLEPPPPGGTEPWLFYPDEAVEGEIPLSRGPIHKYTYFYMPITGEPEPFSYGVSITDDAAGSNVDSVSSVVIPLFGDSGIPEAGQYTWEPADPESDITPVFSDADPSGGVWTEGSTPPNLFVSLDNPSGSSGAYIGWGGGVLTLYAGNDPDAGAGQITIITFLPSGFVYPPVSIAYGPLA